MGQASFSPFGSNIAASSFAGLLTRIEIDHISEIVLVATLKKWPMVAFHTPTAPTSASA